ncbi:MFS transporter [uncultured Corynebacterium sp.]|uniref:MFS transporter n=1 Tax=uncultured Corynebacterium sp. TaxID=159447 RepID=UPI0025DF7661|nr:MFS transporter [uncultured Corynebacterium sp.]
MTVHIAHLGHRTYWMPLVLSCVATFLLISYSTIMTVAVPAISADLMVDFGPLQWAIDIYTIVLAALLVPVGALSDRVDRGKLLAAGLAVFAGSSLLCAVASGIPMLTAGRGLQGLGAAMMFATTLPLLESSYAGKSRDVAFAVWGAVSGLASAAGNVIGGLLSAFAWRGIFVVAVPIALVAVVVALLFLRPEVPGSFRSTDGPGMLLLAVAVGDIVVVLLLLADGSSGMSVMTAIVVFIVAAALLIIREHRAMSPLFATSLVTSRKFGAVVLVAAVYYFAAFGPLPLLSQWLQEGVGQSVVSTSLILSAQPVVFFVVSAAAGTRLARLHRRGLFGWGLVVCGAGCAAMLLAAGFPVWVSLIPSLVLTGVGSGMISPVLPAAAMQGLPADQTGVASTSMNAARQLGLSIGVAVCALILRMTQRSGYGLDAGLGATGVMCTVMCLLAAVGVRCLLPSTQRESGSPSVLGRFRG